MLTHKEIQMLPENAEVFGYRLRLDAMTPTVEVCAVRVATRHGYKQVGRPLDQTTNIDGLDWDAFGIGTVFHTRTEAVRAARGVIADRIRQLAELLATFS